MVRLRQKEQKTMHISQKKTASQMLVGVLDQTHKAQHCMLGSLHKTSYVGYLWMHIKISAVIFFYLGYAKSEKSHKRFNAISVHIFPSTLSAGT